MPYLHLDLPGTYPVDVKRELATRLCKLYADVIETQLWRPNVGIAELGKDNLYHLGFDGREPHHHGHGRVHTASGRRDPPRWKLGCRLDTCRGRCGLRRTKEKSMSNSSEEIALIQKGPHSENADGAAIRLSFNRRDSLELAAGTIAVPLVSSFPSNATAQECSAGRPIRSTHRRQTW
jgi:hypothetical protein